MKLRDDQLESVRTIGRVNIKNQIRRLKEQHPYREDVFKPLNQLEWEQVYEALELIGVDGERVTGNIARIGYESAIAKLEDYEQD